jgi:hypothetical protein
MQLAGKYDAGAPTAAVLGEQKRVLRRTEEFNVQQIFTQQR